MNDITVQERKFLKKLFLSLQNKVNINIESDNQLNTSIINKLIHPNSISFNENEFTYLKQTLCNKLEDACDCRNEHEINYVSELICKIESTQNEHINNT